MEHTSERDRGTTTVGERMTVCPHAVRYDQSLEEATRLMSEHAIRHLPVVRDGAVVGVVSDRDIAVVESLGSTPAARVHVIEAMTPVPYTVTPDTALLHVVRQMEKHKYGCAIVTDGEGREPLGIFTTTDALALLRDLLTHVERDAGSASRT